MARIRSLKPEFWCSEQVVECSPTARLLFIGLWTFSDDGGVHPYSLKRIKLQVFPGDNFDSPAIEALLRELLAVGLLRSFTADGQPFLYVSGWRHQKIEKPTLRWPQPDRQTIFDDASPTISRTVDNHSANGHRHVADQSPTEWSGGRGEEGGERKEAFPLPELPEIIDTPEMREALTDWFGHKGKLPKPRALKILVTRLCKRAEQCGVSVVIEAMQRAISQDYKGWDFDDWFAARAPAPPAAARVATDAELANWNPATGVEQ